MGEYSPFEIIANIGSFDLGHSAKYKKEVNIIKWYNRRKAVIDMRIWDTENDSPLKGLTVTSDEASLLIALLNEAIVRIGKEKNRP